MFQFHDELIIQVPQTMVMNIITAEYTTDIISNKDDIRKRNQ